MRLKIPSSHGFSQERSTAPSWPLASLKACGILALSSLALIGCPSNSGYIGWTYVLGDVVTGHSVSQVSDAGYLVLGFGKPKGSSSDSSYLPAILRISPTGSVEWSKFIDGVYAGLAAAAPDGGEFIVSLSAPNYDTTAVPRVLKLDGNANVLWDRTYGQASGLDSQEPRAVAATVDGGCVVACQRSLVIIGAKGSKTNTYISQVVLRKLDSVGDVVWERNLESPTGYMGVARMIPVNGDGFVLVGADSQILRVDAAGNALWWNLYGGGWTTGVGVASDGGFVLVGTSQKSFPTPEVFRTDASGNLLWSAENIIPNQGNAQYTVRDAILDTEGRIVLVGQLEHVAYVGNFFPIITYDSFIMQLDSSAHLNWSKTLPVYELNGIALTNTGDYVTTGADGNDLKVIRVTTAGKVL